jgi:hypothetical protein
MASAVIIAGAAFLAQVVEPLWEFLVGGATFEWAFGAPRQVAFATYLAAGLVAFVVTIARLRRGRAPVL